MHRACGQGHPGGTNLLRSELRGPSLLWTGTGWDKSFEIRMLRGPSLRGTWDKLFEGFPPPGETWGTTQTWDLPFNNNLSFNNLECVF